MYKKLSKLSFVIGAFFTIVSLILFANIFFSGKSDAVSLYSASVFLLFGITMMVAS